LQFFPTTNSVLVLGTVFQLVADVDVDGIKMLEAELEVLGNSNASFSSMMESNISKREDK
jgi:hypothetical protein